MSASPFDLDVPRSVERIRARESTLHAFVNTRLEEALGEHASKRLPAGPLHGVPFSLKDEWETLCLPTTGGSWRHRDRRSAIDSAVFETFRDAGAVLMGKTNLSDMGLAPEASSYVAGSTRNPFDPFRTAGGSSGGAAAAVAAGLVGFDWGTDIGGSIRLPAAFCGVYGLKLSHECWPSSGLFPAPPPSMARFMGQGPLAHTTAQLRLLLEVARPVLQKQAARPFKPRGGMIYAPEPAGRWPTFAGDVEPSLRRVFDEVSSAHGLPSTAQVSQLYAGLWASHLDDLLEVDPSLSFWPATRAVLSAVLFRGRFGDRRFHPRTAELLLGILVGRYTVFRRREPILVETRALADRVRALWDRGYVLATPVCCYPPPLIGRSNYNLHLVDCTVIGNLADATGLAVPFGRIDGLPRSLQLLGPPGSEDALLDLAEKMIPSPARSNGSSAT